MGLTVRLSDISVYNANASLTHTSHNQSWLIFASTITSGDEALLDGALVAPISETIVFTV